MPLTPVSTPHPHPFPLPTARPQVLQPAQEGVTRQGGNPGRPTTGPCRRPACLLGSPPGPTVLSSVSPSPPQSLGLQALPWLSFSPARAAGDVLGPCCPGRGPTHFHDRRTWKRAGKGGWREASSPEECLLQAESLRILAAWAVPSSIGLPLGISLQSWD